MAVGTVSSVSDDVWQLISTTTMAGATSYTLSSIAGYKRLMVSISNGVKSSGDYYTIRFNGDTSAGNYAGAVGGGGGSMHYFGGPNAASSAALAIIEDADKSFPHLLFLSGYAATVDTSAAYVNPVPITSITILTDGSSTLNSGTIRLYGIAA